ncbi:MAG: hypothetical protein ACKN9T_13555, partial [Candidatus Methylumidiphilus sp.]
GTETDAIENKTGKIIETGASKTSQGLQSRLRPYYRALFGGRCVEARTDTSGLNARPLLPRPFRRALR